MIPIHRYGIANGRPLLLLHAGGVLHHMWQPLIRHWKDRYPMLAVDLPPSMTIAELADHVATLIPQACHRPPWLIGASLGANVALQIAATTDVNIAGLVLDSAQAGGPVPAVLRRMIAAVKRLNRLIPKALVTALLMRTFHHYGSDDQQTIQAEMRSLGLLGLIGHIEAHFAYDVSRHLNQITAPTLIFAGGRDHLTKTGEPQRLQSMIPRSTLTIIPKAGHVTFLSHPSRFYDEVDAFLCTHESEVF